MKPVQWRLADAVAHLEIDRPPLNVLDLATLAELDGALAEIGRARPQPRVLVIRGAGPRAFSAGVAVQDHRRDRIAEMLRRFHGALRRLRALPTVSIAAVHGLCLGGAMELAASCDLVVAEADAELGQPEIDVGCFPPWAAALYPPRIGSHRTLELLLTGRRLTAPEAHRWGLVNRLAERGRLDDEVAAITAELTAKSGAVTALAKAAVRASEEAFEAAVRKAEEIYLGELAEREDMIEGVAAFTEKRPPVWKHR